MKNSESRTNISNFFEKGRQAIQGLMMKIAAPLYSGNENDVIGRRVTDHQQHAYRIMDQAQIRPNSII